MPKAVEVTVKVGTAVTKISIAADSAEQPAGAAAAVFWSNTLTVTRSLANKAVVLYIHYYLLLDELISRQLRTHTNLLPMH